MDERSASIETRFGRAALVAAGDGISVELDAADEPARRALRDVIDTHLRRFARAPIEVVWHDEGCGRDR